MQEVQEPLSGNSLQVQQGTPALSPAEKGPARGPGRRGRSVFYARGWRDMHAVRPAWVRGGAAAQWEAWPLAATPGVVETAGGSSTGRGRRQGLAGLAELQRGFLEYPATGIPWSSPGLRNLKTPPFLGCGPGCWNTFSFVSLPARTETPRNRKTPQTRTWRQTSRRAGTGKKLLSRRPT